MRQRIASEILRVTTRRRVNADAEFERTSPAARDEVLAEARERRARGDGGD